MDLQGEWGWGREDGTGLRQKGHPIDSLAGSPRSPMPCASRRRGWGRRQLSEDASMAPAAAAAVFIFKLLSGQRARRGRGPRPAANLILGRPAAARPPSGLFLAWLPAYLRVLPARALHAGRSPWLWRQWRFWGVSAAAAATARGQDGGPAAHPARPARRATT